MYSQMYQRSVPKQDAEVHEFTCVLLRNTAFLAWKHTFQSHSIASLIEEELVDKECLSCEQAS